jgi:hypothetical protein
VTQYTSYSHQLISYEDAVAIEMERILLEYLEPLTKPMTPLDVKALQDAWSKLDKLPLKATTIYANEQDMEDLKQWAAQQQPYQPFFAPLNRWQKRRERFGPTRDIPQKNLPRRKR